MNQWFDSAEAISDDDVRLLFFPLFTTIFFFFFLSPQRFRIAADVFNHSNGVRLPRLGRINQTNARRPSIGAPFHQWRTAVFTHLKFIHFSFWFLFLFKFRNNNKQKILEKKRKGLTIYLRQELCWRHCQLRYRSYLINFVGSIELYESYQRISCLIF